MQKKLQGIINVDFEATDKVLAGVFCITQILDKKRSVTWQPVSYLRASRKLPHSLRFCIHCHSVSLRYGHCKYIKEREESVLASLRRAGMTFTKRLRLKKWRVSISGKRENMFPYSASPYLRRKHAPPKSPNLNENEYTGRSTSAALDSSE
jgi:hypothetical protein